MMKKVFVLALLLCSCVAVYAQDIITKKNGEDVQVKITEVLVNAIKYKRYDYQDGPTFTMPKSEILMITYANGQRDIINTNVPTTSVPAGTNGNITAKSGSLYYDGAAVLPEKAKYKLLKRHYKPSDFSGFQEGDPYSPARCLWNLLLPGLGQMTMGEGGKGATFLGLSVLSSGVSIGGIAMVAAGNSRNQSGLIWAGTLLSLIGTAGALTVELTSIFDAMRVAKVKDLYHRDRQKLGVAFDCKVAPFVAPIQTGMGYQPAAGLTLALNF